MADAVFSPVHWAISAGTTVPGAGAGGVDGSTWGAGGRTWGDGAAPGVAARGGGGGAAGAGVGCNTGVGGGGGVGCRFG